MSEYSRAHVAVSKVRGPAKDHPCVTCGAAARDWSLFCLDNAQNDGDLLWSPLIEDYEAQCRSCHQRLEYSRGTNRGWKTFWAEEKSPEWMAAFADTARDNAVKARAALQELLATSEGDRVRAAQSEGAKRGGMAQRRRCTCGLVTTAALLPRHQKSKGCEGWKPA